MTKKRFCEILEKIEDTQDLSDAMHDLTWNYGMKHHTDVSFEGVCDPMVSDVIELLEEIMHDTDEDISYFCWELNFGHDWREGSITTQDGRSIDFSTAEKLYDYLEEQRTK